MPNPSAPPAAPSRREQNKSATRAAIAAAAVDLLRSRGMGDFTVEDVAEAAGISRRTFFNYFPSAEAALAVPTESFLDNAINEFLQRPQDEPLLESAQQALIALADPMQLAAMAEVFSLTRNNPQMSRFQLECWDNCTHRLLATTRQRVGDAVDELYLGSLVACVVSCGRVAFEQWLLQCGPDVTPESLSVLRQLLIDAVGHLRDGFAR
jgi:AcrR family transcriptional regulator